MNERTNKSSLSTWLLGRYGYQEVWRLDEKNPDSLVASVALMYDFYEEQASFFTNLSSGIRQLCQKLYRPQGCPILITSRVASFETSALAGRGYATKFQQMVIYKVSTSNASTRNEDNNNDPHFRELSINDPYFQPLVHNADLIVLSPHDVDDVRIINLLRKSKLLLIDKENQKIQRKLEIYEEFLTPGNDITHTIEIDSELLRSKRKTYMKEIIMKLHSFAETERNSNLNIEIKLRNRLPTTEWIFKYQLELTKLLLGIKILQERPNLDLWSFILKAIAPLQEGEIGNESIEDQEAA